MHVASFVPIGIFGLTYIFGNYRAAFYVSVAGHFLVTSLIYYRYGPDDFLGCTLYPFMIGDHHLFAAVSPWSLLN